ncbi:hypothetical protein GcC1_204037 [Golovinomyces cichoracearum]|uniref:Myb/SANT-like domain-containing protein n=1 Tax=Golovinomyces cichoracearum TaxID=62708 RepID=A0A420HD62_9PEZI|nr:hypothetical protein GcC1_204037 [Golovinomyces cichoracearum]
MEATQANVAATRRTRARRGRCGGRGNQKKAQKKAQPKRKPITKDNILTPQHESSSLHLRDQSVPVRSIEWYQTPIRRSSVSNSLRPSTPQLTQYLGPRGSPTSHSTEEQDNNIVKNRRGLKYTWLYERELAMLRALVEAKHSGLQTGSSFREKVWAEARKAVDYVVINSNLAPPITAAQMSNKWGDWKKWWPDYEAHYCTSSVKRHTSGWEKNSSGREFSYPGIDTGVLVSSLDAMRDHYNAYPKCRGFRKHRVNHVELLEQLLAKIDVWKQAILNSTEEASFERLAMAINRQNKSKTELAIQRVEKLGIFKNNIEAIGCLYEAFFADEKKADFFVNLPTKMMVWWVEKGFGGTIKLDTNWNAVDVALDQIGVGTARKRRRVSEEAGNSDLHEDIEEGNGDFDEFIGEVGSEDEFLERFSQ